MSLFVNSNDNNFYGKVCNELERARLREPEACHFIEFQPTGAAIVKLDGNQDSSALARIWNGAQEEIKKVDTSLYENPKNISSLANLEGMFRTFNKVRFDFETVALTSRDNEKYRPEFMHKTLDKIESTIFEILEKVAYDAESWKQLVQNENSILNAAIRGNKKELIFSLIENGADLNAFDAYGNTALIFACTTGDTELASALIEKGADVNKKNKAGASALHKAVAKGCHGIVQLLLQHGADVNVEAKNHNSPLITACRKEHFEIAKTLLAHGADVNSALIKAARNGRLDTVQLLLEYPKTLSSNKAQRAFEEACYYGHLDIYIVLFAAFLTQGIDLQAQKQIIMSSFHRACASKHTHVVEWFLDHGVAPQINSEDKDGDTALYIASDRRRAKTVVLLIARGADVNKKDKKGFSALHIACKENRPDIVEELLKRDGIEVDSQSDDGDFPLLAASSVGSLEMVKALFAKGANINKKNKNDHTLLHYAVWSDYSFDETKWLVENGAHIDAEMDDGNTPLLRACQVMTTADVRKTVHFLLDKGADINKQNRKGDTALSLALEKGDRKLIARLIVKNIKESYFFKFKNGTTPLHTLFSNSHLVDAEQFADLFFRLGSKCDITCKDKRGRTPLQCLPTENSVNPILLKILTRIAKRDVAKYTHLLSTPGFVPPSSLDIILFQNDKIKAHTIARQLTAEQFVERCKELEKIYPKTPVLEFFFESFIRSPVLDQPPLPQGHIKALFSYLRTKMDVAPKSVPQGCLYQLTPYYMLYTLNHDSAKSILLEIFQNFKNFNQGVSNFSTFVKDPKLLLEPVDGQSEINPLEVAFLYGSISLARALATVMTKKEFRAFAEKLKKTYRKSHVHVNEFLFNTEFNLSTGHMQKGVPVIPPKPEGVEVRDLRTFFNKINFTNPQAPLYFAPKEHGLNADPAVLSKVMNDFIEKVEKRIAYLGTPPKGTDALKVFYQIIENAVTNVIKKLQTVEDARYQAQTIIDFLKDIALCGGKIFTISIEIFHRVVHGIDSNYDNKLLFSLGDLRSFLARDVIPEGPHNVHDYNKFIKAKGKTLGIPGSVEGARYNDICQGSEGYNPDHSEKKFKNRYVPWAVAQWLQPQFATDPVLREKYTAWWKLNAPKEWGRDKYEPIKRKLSQLQEQGASKAEIEKFLDNHEIGQADIEDARTHAFIEQEVYEDIGENSFKEFYFINSLMKLGILTKIGLKYKPEPKPQQVDRGCSYPLFY
jgi:ankyrin repeat protein